MKLFEYAIIHNPIATKDESDRGVTPKSVLIVDVKRVLANNEREVGVLAARSIPDEFTDRLDQIDIAIRPF